MELKEATIKEVQAERPDLVESIRKETLEPVQKKLTETEAQLKEAQGKLAAQENKVKLDAQNAAVDKALKEATGIPEPSKERIKAQFSSLVEGDINVVLKEAIAKELDYVNKLTGKGKVKTGEGSGNEATLRESYESELESRAGLKKAETKKE